MRVSERGTSAGVEKFDWSVVVGFDGPTAVFSDEVEVVDVEVGVVGGANKRKVCKVGFAAMFIIRSVMNLAVFVRRFASRDSAPSAVTGDHGESL